MARYRNQQCSGYELRMAKARGHEFLDSRDGLNAAPGSGRGAVECGGGTGEVEPAFQRPVLQKPVDKAGVEDVPGARSVDDGNSIGRQLMKLVSIPCQHAVVA